MQEILAKAKTHLRNQMPFVVYANPNSNQLNAFFQLDDKLELFKEQSGFVFAPFNSDEKYCISAENSHFFSNEIPLTEIINSSEITISENLNKRLDFELLVENAVKSIQNNNFNKVVLSRKVALSISLDIFTSLQNLFSNYTSAFRYLFYHPKIGTWMGATPEQLLKIENNELNTVALAGTQLFSDNIVWEQKELQEQQFVTDFITNELEQFSEKISISESFTEKAGLLAHIKTIISAKLKHNFIFADLLDTLHPTPAVCGLPKPIALQYILENENYDRKFYTGFLGEYNINNTTNLFVNLRCMEIEANVVSLYVGCGITKASNPEKEYIETQNKLGTILKILKRK